MLQNGEKSPHFDGNVCESSWEPSWTISSKSYKFAKSTRHEEGELKVRSAVNVHFRKALGFYSYLLAGEFSIYRDKFANHVVEWASRIQIQM